MGNGISTDQGNLPAHGKRDVGEKADTRQYDWSELAEAPITKQPTTLSPVVSMQKPYSMRAKFEVCTFNRFVAINI